MPVAGEGSFLVGATREGTTSVAASRLGWALDGATPNGDGDASIGAVLAALPPSRRPSALLALAFEEDFALIDGVTATIPWLAVCLPSRWAPEEKIGRHFAEVHAPVADNETLVAASASLARLVTGEDRWERFVWTISVDSRLHQHPARGGPDWPIAAEADADTLAAHAFFRTERQRWHTRRPLFRSGEIIGTSSSWLGARKYGAGGATGLRQQPLENHGHRRRASPVADRLLFRRRRTARARQIDGPPTRDHF